MTWFTSPPATPITTNTPSKKEQLAARIAHLQLSLKPLIPLPTGAPHPDFPQTLLNYHLLTEEQLDSMAHYYHQSTPCIWTHQYPACMNWDKDLLVKRRASVAFQHTSQTGQQEGSTQWLHELLAVAEAKSLPAQRRYSVQFGEGMTDAERIAIKRRKLGKFVGLMGCETPEEEIEGRLKASMDRAIRLAQEELRRAKEWELRRSKMV